jgi:hypothetical protein
VQALREVYVSPPMRSALRRSEPGRSLRGAFTLNGVTQTTYQLENRRTGRARGAGRAREGLSGAPQVARAAQVLRPDPPTRRTLDFA